MEPLYEKSFVAGWSDMDFNAHMSNTAYLDRAVDVRLLFYSEHGFPVAEFASLGVGPVVRKDEVEYFKEIRLLEAIRATLGMAGMAADGSRLLLRNEFYRGDGKLAARVVSTIGWLDLRARRLVAPPERLLRALQAMRRTEDFYVLPSSVA